MSPIILTGIIVLSAFYVVVGVYTGFEVFLEESKDYKPRLYFISLFASVFLGQLWGPVCIICGLAWVSYALLKNEWPK